MVLTTAGQATSANARTLQLLGPYGNVSLLERPVRTATLVAAVRTALRARRRQYESRDYLTMRERVVAELGAARVEAERVSQAKDDFLAMLGHELRNPLAAIVSGLAVLERFPAQEEAEQQARGIVRRQVRHLTRLVDDLLDVSRIMSGKITLRRAPVDLREVARQCVESRQVATVGAHDLSLVAEADPVIVDGDPVRLEQIVSNLLDNAVKYSSSGQPIRVLVRREDGQAVLRLRDRGISIAARAGWGWGSRSRAVSSSITRVASRPTAQVLVRAASSSSISRSRPPLRCLPGRSSFPRRLPAGSSWSRITPIRARRFRSC